MAAGPSISDASRIAELIDRVPHKSARLGSCALQLTRLVRKALFAFTMQRSDSSAGNSQAIVAIPAQCRMVSARH
jgi:hypothetical protein